MNVFALVAEEPVLLNVFRERRDVIDFCYAKCNSQRCILILAIAHYIFLCLKPSCPLPHLMIFSLSIIKSEENRRNDFINLFSNPSAMFHIYRRF